MIVKFLGNKGGGSAGATMDYMLGKDRDREGAILLSGDPDLTARIADNLDFQNRYTVGVLSFEESNLEQRQKEKIMQSFEDTLLAGLERDQYDITWIEHQDKGRLELNFIIPNVELSTGKRLQPYFDQADRPLVENWKQVTNFEHGLSDPHAPDKAQAIKVLNSQNLPESVKEIKQQIGTVIAEQISKGNIQNRQDVVNTLESAGFDITRQTDKSISIKNPDGKRNIRLEGVIYENRRFGEEFRAEHSRTGQEYQETSRERYQTALGKLQRLTTKNLKQNREHLERNLQTIEEQQPSIVNALRLNTLKGAVLGVLVAIFLIFLGITAWLGKEIRAKQQELAEINLELERTPLENRILRMVEFHESEDKKAYFIVAKNAKKAEAYTTTGKDKVLKIER